MNAELLILSAPAETLLELTLFAAVAGTCLLILSIEADNYADLLDWMRSVRGSLLRYRGLRRRLLLQALDTDPVFV